MKKLLCITFIIAYAFVGDLWAQSGNSSFDFMLIGLGSRASAMGEAVTAVSGDAGAPYFNPASAALLSGTEFSFMHVAYLTDVTMDHFSVITEAKKFHYGFGMYYGKVADFERRDLTPTDQPLGTFDEHNFTASVLWALQVSERISIGNAIKVAYEKIDRSSASALGLDLGISYAIKPRITFGASIRNLGTKPKFEQKKYDLPRELRLGLSYRTQPGTKLGGLVLASDFVQTKWGDKKSKLNLGGEYTYQNLFAFRLGYGIGYDSRNISLGGGIAYKSYFFDYAFVPAKNNLSDTHRFTFRVKI
jgi:hypothetical protein